MKGQVEFTVTGRTIMELERTAHEGLAALGEGRKYTAHLRIRPIVESYGSAIPEIWEAQVEATIQDDPPPPPPRDLGKPSS